MKIFKYFAIGLLVLSSCENETLFRYDLSIQPEEITRLELRADHKTLLPNGVSRVGFQTLVYATRNTMNYPAKDADGLAHGKYIETEFLIPVDQVPEGIMKLYDADGKELVNGYYSTATDVPGTVHTFYAKAGTVESNRLTVTIRELPDESYPEIVIPVIFHILQPPAGEAATYELSSEFLAAELKRVSDSFNGKMSNDPNLGNAKITFKLAIYGQNKVKLDKEGVNIMNITTADYDEIAKVSTQYNGYLGYILKKKSDLIWDPNKYLNIWVARFSNSSTATGSSTAHRFLPPYYIHSDYVANPIPGHSLTETNSFGLEDVDVALRGGILVNLKSLTMPTSVMGATNEYRLAYSLALHYGLTETNITSYANLIDGDNDYCSDTYYYYYSYYMSARKGNNLSKWPEGKEIEYFTSFNVLDLYGYKNSISVDQAHRLREVLKKCPDRWTYKSNWALTGN